MKKRMICILIFIFTFIFTSCSVISDDGSSEYKTADRQAKDLQNQIMECFVNKDKETLKSFFCEYALVQSQRIDMEIDYAFDFIDGEIVSYDEPKTGATGSKERKYYGATTHNIITDKGTEYKIDFGGWLTNDKEPDKVGVINIRIVNMTQNSELPSDATKEERLKCCLYIGESE